MKDYHPSKRTIRYFYAIPLQGTLGKKAKDRGVAFRFPIKTEQTMAENFMRDMGYNNHQYIFQTDEQFHADRDCAHLTINQVEMSIRASNTSLKWIVTCG